MIDVKSYDNLRYSKRDDDPLIIVNKEPKSKGFMVCKECGAAVPGDDSVPLSKMLKPFGSVKKGGKIIQMITKKRITSLITAATLISGMILSAGTTVLGANSNEQNTPAKYYKTNPSGTGIKATISIDGDISDWSKDALIAQGAANDLPCVYQNTAYNGSRPDLYALYGAYDSKNLYLMWEMTDVCDVTSPDGIPDDFGDAYGVDENPFFIAIGTAQEDTIGNHGKTYAGYSIENKGICFDGAYNRVITVTASDDPQTNVYMGSENGINPLPLYTSSKSGISIYGGEGILSSQVYGISGDSGRTLYDVCDNNASWTDFCSQGHNSSMDRHYEMSVPLSVLGVTEEQVDKL